MTLNSDPVPLGNTKKSLEVVQIMRFQFSGAFSLERVFKDIASAMPTEISLKVATLSHPSSGLLPRIRAGFEARRFRKKIIHVTGDVHFVGLFLPRATTILTIHDCVLLTRNRGLKRWLIYFFWYRFPILHATVVTAISEETRRQIIQNVPIKPEKIRVVPNPLSRDFLWSPKDHWPKRPRLLHIGTKPNKNIERTIVALSGLNVTLEIIGQLRDEQISELKSRKIDYRNSYNLSDDDIHQKYLDCDGLLFVSTEEGFGLPILEAQAVGRPVITSDQAPMSDVANEAAILVDPEDAQSIRTGVESLINDHVLRAHIIAKGRENVSRYSPEAIAAMYAEIYREVAAANNS